VKYRIKGKELLGISSKCDCLGSGVHVRMWERSYIFGMELAKTSLGGIM